MVNCSTSFLFSSETKQKHVSVTGSWSSVNIFQNRKSLLASEEHSLLLSLSVAFWPWWIRRLLWWRPPRWQSRCHTSHSRVTSARSISPTLRPAWVKGHPNNPTQKAYNCQLFLSNRLHCKASTDAAKSTASLNFKHKDLDNQSNIFYTEQTQIYHILWHAIKRLYNFKIFSILF